MMAEKTTTILYVDGSFEDIVWTDNEIQQGVILFSNNNTSSSFVIPLHNIKKITTLEIQNK